MRIAVLGVLAVALAAAGTAGAFTPTDPLASRQWYLAQDHAFDLWPDPPDQTLFTPAKVAIVDSIGGGQLVLRRTVSADVTELDRFWFAWDEAQLEAERAYEAWSIGGRDDRYVVYRAAQDRADAAQDALARYAAQCSPF